ncbi:MAG: hypothetical protein MK434_06880 [SAR324 cluster bacterium]|nr:hypothetical protein [SAR324 cluster bacterium]
MHYSTPFLLCSQMAGGTSTFADGEKNLENPVMTSTGNLSPQARQIRNVYNAILEQCNGLAEKIKQKLRYIHAFTTATISSSGGKVNYLIW